MHKSLLAFAFAAALAAPGLAAAQQVAFFRIQMSGLEHCADFDNFKFGSKNSDPMFVKIVDDLEWDLASNDIFDVDHTTPLIGKSYLSTTKKLTFTGAQFTDTTFIALDATASLDKNSVPTKISGTFILQAPQDPNDPNSPLCNQTGKFKTLQRVLQQP